MLKKKDLCGLEPHRLGCLGLEFLLQLEVDAVTACVSLVYPFTFRVEGAAAFGLEVLLAHGLLDSVHRRHNDLLAAGGCRLGIPGVVCFGG